MGGRVATPDSCSTSRRGWCGITVLGVFVWFTPTLALAADAGLGYDATFRAFLRGGANFNSLERASITPALLGPPTRTPRRAPRLDPVTPAAGEVAGEPEPATQPAPSDSSAATPPDTSATTTAPSGTRVIPRPNAAPVPDDAAAALEAEPAEEDTQSGPSRAQMERALPSESGPPPSAEPLAPIETGPARFVRGKSVQSASLLHTLPGELLEMVLSNAHPWVGAAIKNLKVPAGAILATIERGGEIVVPTGDTELKSGDRLVVFALPDAIGRLEAFLDR